MSQSIPFKHNIGICQLLFLFVLKSTVSNRNQPESTVIFQIITNQVNPKSITKHVNDNGDEIIVIPSYTLPDNVVMNGGLYPAEEIEKAYRSLEGVPAPIGHPEDASGSFVPASSEIGVNEFQAGVFNKNVRRDGNRIYVEKHINTRVAKTLNRGPELLDRIETLIGGESAEPIHTSTGLYCDADELEKPKTNEAGTEYTWVAKDMIFDHDAILLDEEGAATPDDGVGMMVNKDGKRLVVNMHNLTNKSTGEYNQPESTKNNRNQLMKDKLMKMLKENGYGVADNMSEEDMMNMLGKSMKKKDEGKDKKADSKADADEIAKVVAESVKTEVANAVKPLKAELDAMKANAKAKEEAENAESIAAVVSNAGLTEEEVKSMPIAVVNKMAAKYAPPAAMRGNFGGFQANSDSSGDMALDSDMVED